MTLTRSLLSLMLFAMIVVAAHAQQAGSSPSPLQAKADSLFLANNFVQAISAYEAFLKKDTSNAIVWNRYGYSLHRTGKLDQAMKAYQNAMNLKPASGVQLTVLSRIAMIQGMNNDRDGFFSTIDTMIRAGYADLDGYDTTAAYASMRTDSRFAAMKTRIEGNAYPCMHHPKFRLFDFWIGEWVVNPTNNPNTIAGWSKIEVMSGGCGILENWRSNSARGAASGPFEGKSINYYDSTLGGWQQYWVGSGSSGTPMSYFYNGQNDESLKAMVFETNPGPGPNGETQIGRLRFFNQGPDQVRQWSESSSDSGKSWTTSYDLTYKRKK